MRRSLLVIITPFILLGCGHFFPEHPRSQPEFDADAWGAELLERDLPGDEFGFIYSDECDSLLFSALRAVGRREPIQIREARGASGAWYRRPLSYELCYPKHSASSISRDMLLGVIWYAHAFKDPELVRSLWDYAEAHNFIMGEAKDPVTQVTRTLLSPALSQLLAAVLVSLEGTHAPDTAKALALAPLPEVYSAEPGFTSHLSMLQIALWGELRRGITEKQMGALLAIKTHSPNNPMLHVLLDLYSPEAPSAYPYLVRLWPAGRLASNQDWCEPWRAQRADLDRGLLPCLDSPKLHSTGDVLFLLRLLKGD